MLYEEMDVAELQNRDQQKITRILLGVQFMSGVCPVRDCVKQVLCTVCMMTIVWNMENKAQQITFDDISRFLRKITSPRYCGIFYCYDNMLELLCI